MWAHLRAGWKALAGIMLVLAVLGLTCLGAAGAEPPADVGSAPATPARDGYRIASGDTLSITVWGQEQFSQECQVNGAGTISYPLLGDVAAAGLTCRQLQADLEKGLRKYLKQPQVLVRVTHYGLTGTSVFVLGEVKAPGVYPVSSRMGLLQTLAAAGGATNLASGDITLVKARSGEIQTLGLEAAFAGDSATGTVAVEPGDVLVVNRKAGADRRLRFAVLGEVPRPGMYDIPADCDISVLDALKNAGLLDTSSTGQPQSTVDSSCGTADLEHALLTRGDVVVPVNLVALLGGDTSQNLLLQEGDVLTIPRRSLIAIYALGEVRSPGKQEIPAHSTVMNLLNAVGGVTSAAHLSDATLIRSVDGQPQSIRVNLGALLHQADAAHNIALQDGDVLFVPTKGDKRGDILRFLPIVPYLLN